MPNKMLNTVIAILLPAFDLGVESFFNIGWGAKPAGPTSILAGGGGSIAKCIYTHACTLAHVCIHTHACSCC